MPSCANCSNVFRTRVGKGGLSLRVAHADVDSCFRRAKVPTDMQRLFSLPWVSAISRRSTNLEINSLMTKHVSVLC